MRLFIATALLLATGAGRGFAEPAAGGRPNSMPPTRATVSTPADAHDAAAASCVDMWDRGTHMTKREWRRACQRVQNRLERLPVN